MGKWTRGESCAQQSPWLALEIHAGETSEAKWTRGESNPLLIHAMDACYRYTTGPRWTLRDSNPRPLTRQVSALAN